jgi:hypothetical protein
MHDESLDETEGWMGVKPVQQWHSGSKPDVTRIMSGKHGKDRRMWTGVGGDEAAQRHARGWARGMTQGGPGGHLVGVRGDKPRGEIAHGPADIDYADETGETGMRAISGKDINPHSLVFKPLPTPPPAQEMGEAQHSEEEKEAARDRLKEIEREIAHGGDSNEDEFNELNAILQSKPEPIGPEYRYDDEANDWVLVKQYGQEPSFETKQVEEAPPETDDSLDVGTDFSMEENDPCCEQAKQKWLDGIQWDNDKPGFEGKWDFYNNLTLDSPCDNFYKLMENVMNEQRNDDLYANEKKIATEVLQEWDACAGQQFSGDMFTAGHGSAGVLVKQYGQEPSFATRQVEEMPPETDDSLDVGTGVGMGEDDPCCEQAKQAFASFFLKHWMSWGFPPISPEQFLEVNVWGSDCATFRENLEEDASIPLVLDSTGQPVGSSVGDQQRVQGIKTIIEEWDACAEQQLPADDPMFTMGEGSAGVLVSKHAESPEAKRHKYQYDKKYMGTPERIKYREDLNRERRKRGIYGRGGPDMSHTKRGTLVAEDPHANRARHFKGRGTLKSVAVMKKRPSKAERKRLRQEKAQKQRENAPYKPHREKREWLKQGEPTSHLWRLLHPQSQRLHREAVASANPMINEGFKLEHFTTAHRLSLENIGDAMSDTFYRKAGSPIFASQRAGDLSGSNSWNALRDHGAYRDKFGIYRELPSLGAKEIYDRYHDSLEEAEQWFNDMGDKYSAAMQEAIEHGSIGGGSLGISGWQYVPEEERDSHESSR